jgi:hypothetical protein
MVNQIERQSRLSEKTSQIFNQLHGRRIEEAIPYAFGLLAEQMDTEIDTLVVQFNDIITELEDELADLKDQISNK